MDSRKKVVIPIKSLNSKERYLIRNLLNDGSVNYSSELWNLIKSKLDNIPKIQKLLHPEVRYEVTDHCNAECIMCPREEHANGREHGVMKQEEFERSIDEIIQLGAERIVLTGFGEPFLDKGLEQKIAYAKMRNLSTYIISNGSVLNEKRAKGVLEAGLDEIRISFYGMRKETYNKVMVGLDYQKTHDGLINFINLRDALGANTKIQLSYLTMPENQEDEQLFKAYWEPKVDALEIWRPHNFGDGRDYRDTNDNNLKSKKITCGRPENGPLQIQWNGEVIPCCYDYNNKIILGNAFENSVIDIINNDKYKLLRYAHSIGEFGIFPYCDQCDQLLPHSDALVYTNRHNLPPEIAVKLSNTDLYNLADAKEIDQKNLSEKYMKSDSSK